VRAFLNREQSPAAFAEWLGEALTSN
jgi:hypothetical protein